MPFLGHSTGARPPAIFGEKSLQSSSNGRSPASTGMIRHDWTCEEVGALFALPFPDLMFEAQRVHRMHFDPREVQISTLLSIKTGGCPGGCGYFPQGRHYQ